MGRFCRLAAASARQQVRLLAALMTNRPRSRRHGTPVPPAAAVVAVIGVVVFFALPLVGLLWRAPWGSVFSVLGDEASRQALRVSLVTSLSATALSVVFGLPIAW